LRIRILTLLNQKVTSPSQLAAELEEPIGNVSYHVRILADLGMIELVRTEPRRGALEHYYRAIERPHLSNEDWAQLPTSVRRAVSDSVLRMIAKDFAHAAKTGGIDRDNAHATRLTLLLDQKGWDQLSALLDRTLERAMKIGEQSAGRLAGGDGQGEAIPAGLVLLLFEGALPEPKRGESG